MTVATPSPAPRGLALMFGWRRVLLALGVSALMGLVISPGFTTTPTIEVMVREMPVGLATLIAFGLFEQWPARLPRWIARWCVQVAAVALVIPFTVLAIYLAITQGDAVPFWKNSLRVNGFFTMTMTGIVVAPWIAVAALFRQRERERSELERQALDARLRLLQAQVEPHFLFNTLANVQALVRVGLAAGLGGARQPHRLPARGGAATARAGHDARAGAAAGARLPRADAHAHARPPAVRAPGRRVRAAGCAVRR